MYSSYYQSPLGILRITATDTYIKEIHFCRDEEMPASFEPATLTPLLQLCTEQLIGYFQGVRRIFELPVHQEGTPFQQKVWTELTAIPFGKTISYLDLARKLGDPKVIRAAATTNGKNKIAIIVPCHRIIGSNREMVGYAAGIWRKKWLLQHELKIAHGVQTLF
ncbi:methylated-DNA--[protein]-cysteine S-methyltransferase [Flavihumibacter fluvii]|uniref:methylated-DNA--[protein]-cysteine S-methyltransferase n=1 Tax=Flavihumibacter fluvii TaxID=2838157 RepID=UPI001BDF1AC5|nr:methylated-DNA--[protein]-cysteine S-methyltransferase [Flavihumibacter fluvii]ULQ53880.1 methylated-DNA--[protein]-cysteine S-methyltransferase [Flavihumibacter fluvii]